MRTVPNGLYRYQGPLHSIGWLPTHLPLEPPFPLKTTTERRTATAPSAAAAAAPRNGERGQAMVEFAAVLLPLLVIVVGIIQFGLLFGANVSLTNAAREAARAASIHRYVAADGNAAEGVERCTSAVEAATQAFGFLTAAAPNFSASTPCPGGVDQGPGGGDGLHDRWSNGDLQVAFCAGGTQPDDPCPDPSDSTTFCTVDSGEGCLVRVDLSYNQPIVVPLLDGILDGDGNGLFQLRADAAMVMN